MRGKISGFLAGSIVRLPDGELVGIFRNDRGWCTVFGADGQHRKKRLRSEEVTRVATSWDLMRNYIRAADLAPAETPGLATTGEAAEGSGV